MVVGGALLDATVMKEEPVADTANVEMTEAEAKELIEILRARNEAMAVPRDFIDLGPTWRGPDEAAPGTAITVELPRYEFIHGATTSEMAIELRPGCPGAVARFDLYGTPHALPARVTLLDGTYSLFVTCPEANETTVHELVVGPR